MILRTRIIVSGGEFTSGGRLIWRTWESQAFVHHPLINLFFNFNFYNSNNIYLCCKLQLMMITYIFTLVIFLSVQ
ncbi:hypothetical protein JHK82_038861 [Glycine max]|uniref:Uncharacterized protein n=2 Tax=Glycine subgen. Soja TaxID=1462606 RepID=K7M529_SOYBN|nr:hypothetical protein JHK87_038832 [Glycine soja]KAG4962172.1 hypothetical protein JHK86_039040 [Glycine max]KAG4964652.1 hypothetical protein JHK85_039627 [Glycine max]KAG5109638.1 hypothetical protein JHK82_038861 [Glycine max]KAG5120929.1 hypothetical protein JHK84_039269 [Glycine max]